jgi:hypothetical protein
MDALERRKANKRNRALQGGGEEEKSVVMKTQNVALQVGMQIDFKGRSTSFG